jgi:signal peptidase I
VVGLLGAAAVVVVLVARPRRVSVEGPSMEPSLRGGDRLLVLRRPRPTAGDIVALEDPGTGTGTGTVAPLERPRQTRRPPRLIVKRVVSVAGDTVVVWGDNLASSTDSRVFGPVDRSAIVGRAVYRYFPPERSGRLR